MAGHEAEAKIAELGLDMSTSAPLANYVPAVRTGQSWSTSQATVRSWTAV